MINLSLAYRKKEQLTNFERLESRFQLRSVFRWNIEASVEGSHIFLRANEHT